MEFAKKSILKERRQLEEKIKKDDENGKRNKCLEEFSKYLGVYKHYGMGELEILKENNTLVARYGSLDLPLEPLRNIIFKANVPAVLAGLRINLTFSESNNGKISSVSLPLGWDPLLDDIRFIKKD